MATTQLKKRKLPQREVLNKIKSCEDSVSEMSQ